MYFTRPHSWFRPAAAAGMLLAALGARGADAPAASPQLEKVPVTTDVHAPNPTVTPEAYKAMQLDAPEDVVIHVVLLKTEAAQTEDHRPGALLVEARAMVTAVTRSTTKLTVGSAIYLQYPYIPQVPGMPAPPPVPVLKVNGDYRAYLVGGPANLPYAPSAGAESFLDPGVDPGAKEGEAQPVIVSSPTAGNGPIADPSMLPTPQNPTPPGAVKVRGTALTQFAQVVDLGGGKWGVSVAGGIPIELWSIGGAKPVLLVYYGPLLRRAPPTQPIVITYQAGVEPAPPPDKGDVTVERALILDSDKHFLGDMPWDLLTPENMRPLPVPLWSWSSYKLTVEDPDTHAARTILLTSTPPPEPVVSSPSPSPAASTGVSPAPAK